MWGVVPTNPPSTISNSVPRPPWPRPLLCAPPATTVAHNKRCSHTQAQTGGELQGGSSRALPSLKEGRHADDMQVLQVYADQEGRRLCGSPNCAA